jgi:hypothetical protein
MVSLKILYIQYDPYLARQTSKNHSEIKLLLESGSVFSIMWQWNSACMIFLTRWDKRAPKKMKSKERFWKFMQQVELFLQDAYPHWSPSCRAMLLCLQPFSACSLLQRWITWCKYELDQSQIIFNPIFSFITGIIYFTNL